MEEDFNLGKIKSYFDKMYTDEYFEKLSKKVYEEDRNYPENFSNWHPHIITTGAFAEAEIIANQIFTWEETEKLRHTDDILKVDWNIINYVLKPTINKLSPYVCYNIKNGCFSNKFNFSTCICDKSNIAQHLWDINYESSMLDTGGYTELVVREYISYNINKQVTIYNGMPLREEVRVFYNMDTKEIEYMVDYWDYDYCMPRICNQTDILAFDWFHNKIPGREIQHKELLSAVMETIESQISTLKFDGELKGIWSIDFMFDEISNEIYLIDMARGYRSAYWNPNKLKPQTKEQLKYE